MTSFKDDCDCVKCYDSSQLYTCILLWYIISFYVFIKESVQTQMKLKLQTRVPKHMSGTTVSMFIMSVNTLDVDGLVSQLFVTVCRKSEEAQEK